MNEMRGGEGSTVALVVEHPAYAHGAELSDGARAQLAADLAEP